MAIAKSAFKIDEAYRSPITSSIKWATSSQNMLQTVAYAKCRAQNQKFEM
jgi:hypothetical protein